MGIAPAGKLPVEHGHKLPVIDEEIAAAKIAVHQTGTALRRRMARQPVERAGEDLRFRRQIAQPAAPLRDLRQRRRFRWHAAGRQRVNFRQLARQLRRQRRPETVLCRIGDQGLRGRSASAPPHDEKRPADNARIRAQPQRFGHGDARRRDRLQNGEFLGLGPAGRQRCLKIGAQDELPAAGQLPAVKGHIERPVLLHRPAGQQRRRINLYAFRTSLRGQPFGQRAKFKAGARRYGGAVGH